MFESSLTQISAFLLISCKNCIVCLIGPKINKKEAGFGHFFKLPTLLS